MAVRSANLLSIILLSVSCCHAQTVEQLWPPDSTTGLADVVLWDAQTMIAFGANDAILQSDDGGRHWSTVRWGNVEWNFYRAVKTPAGVFLLAERPLGKRDPADDRDHIRLLHYDPPDRRLIAIPMPSWARRTEYLWLDAQGDILSLLAWGRDDSTRLVCSSNFGLSWESVPLPVLEREIVFIGVFFRDRKFIGCLARHGQGEFRLFLTTNGGASWQERTGLALDQVRYQDISAFAGTSAVWTQDNTIILTVYAGGWNGKYHFVASTDFGATWERRAERPRDIIALRALNSSTVCYTDFLRNVYLSEDGCRTFRQVAPGTAAQQPDYASRHFEEMPTGLAIDADGRILVADRRGNLRLSTDNGDSWQYIRKNILDLNNVFLFDDGRALLDARDIVTGVRSLYHSQDGGRSWSKGISMDSAGFAHIKALTATCCFALPARAMADSSAVFRSLDAGHTWACVRKDRRNESGYAFVQTETDSAFIAVKTERRYMVTTDRGDNWADIPPPVTGYVQWLGVTGDAWVGGKDAVSVARADFRTGSWNRPIPVLEYPGYYLGVYAFSPLHATVASCYRMFHTTAGGEVWETVETMDCHAYRGWSHEDGRGVKLHLTGDEGLIRYWYHHPVHVTDNYWQNESLTKIWYGADHFMLDSYVWRTSTDGDTQYLLTDQLLLRVAMPPLLHVAEREAPRPGALAIDLPAPHPIPREADAAIAVRGGNDPAQLRLEAFDLFGRRVAVLRASAPFPGGTVFRWNTAEVPRGMYLLRARAGGSSSVRSVIVR